MRFNKDGRMTEVSSPDDKTGSEAAFAKTPMATAVAPEAVGRTQISPGWIATLKENAERRERERAALGLKGRHRGMGGKTLIDPAAIRSQRSTRAGAGETVIQASPARSGHGRTVIGAK